MNRETCAQLIGFLFGILFACSIYFYVQWKHDLLLNPKFETGFMKVAKDAHTNGPWFFKGGNIAVYAVKGERPYMEDRFSIVDNDVAGEKRFVGFAVYDGHGGSFFSDYAERYLLPSIMRNFMSTPSESRNLTKILIDEFHQLDKRAMDEGGKKHKMCGSTSLVGLTYQQKLYVANIGDCRAVAKMVHSNEVIQITNDHKPNEEGELARIKEAGGSVSFKGVWRVGGMLAVSRVFGDEFLKEKGWLISTPDVFIIDLKSVPLSYLLFASDGLWDVFESQDAVDFILPYLESDPFFGAGLLAEKALEKGSSDNVCVLIVKFI